jgi:hypothetical protein
MLEISRGRYDLAAILRPGTGGDIPNPQPAVTLETADVAPPRAQTNPRISHAEL